MNVIQQGILALIKSAVTQAPQPLPEGFDLETAYPQITRHHIPTLAFEGALLCGIPRQTPAMQKLFQSYCRALVITEGQDRETERITAAFEEAGIHYMPLKGCNMRSRYPKPELRLMGDADILIRMEQYDRIVPIMGDLGYTRIMESDHELIWECPSLNVELHKRIIPSYNKDLYAYFGTGWEFACQAEGCRHSMTVEDEFVYLFAHFAKHYRSGGIGCRHVADLWVFLRAFPDMDGAQVRRKLERLELLEFYDNIRRLIDVWFEGAAEDEKSEFITAYLFGSGSWGGTEAHVLSEGLRTTGGADSGFRGKGKYLWRLAFPNLLAMREQYPVLRKAPILLPVLWLWRPFDKVFLQRKSMQVHRDRMAMLTTDKLKDRQQALRYVGLDFE